MNLRHKLLLSFYVRLIIPAKIETILKLFTEGLSGKNFRFNRGVREDSWAYLT